MTEESDYLIEVARKISLPYQELPGMVAAMITGSAAKGLADNYSDIDMTMYWQALPEDQVLANIMQQYGASERTWFLGNRDDGSFAEAYQYEGIEIQIGHTTTAAWEAAMDSVLIDHECGTPTHKALEGTLNCIPFFGEVHIESWQQRIADYPDELARAMIQHHMKIMPVWGLQHHFASRDAQLWLAQLFSEATFNILGLLAGLNKLYFTDFQFKRTRYFINQMSIKPALLATRLEQLLTGEVGHRGEILRQLVNECAELVSRHYPDIDIKPLTRRLDWTQPHWRLHR
ncbi:MAG: hypothetical protein ACE37D_21760 [Pseudomonadales bacterium]